MVCLLLLADSGYDQLLREGQVALSAGRLYAARPPLERAVKVNPSGGAAWAALAQVYARLNFAMSGRTAAAKAESLAGKDPAVLRGLADYYVAAGDRARAAEYEERFAAAVAASDPAATLRAISLRIESKQPKLAIALAQKVLAAGDRAL